MVLNVLDPKNAEKFIEAVNDDPEFERAARHVSLNLMLGVGLGYGDKQIYVQIHGGKVVKFEHLEGVYEAAPEITLKASAEFWENYLKPIPNAPYHAFYAGMFLGKVMLLGNMELYMAYNWAITRLTDMMRIFQNQLPAEDATIDRYQMGEFESQVGRYVYVEVEGVKYRIYYEENGQGIPLVCQHTAGCDGQQYRYLINDPDITSKYRVIVYDLPFHGKSQPPKGVKWWAHDYELRTEWIVNFHKAFFKALNLPKGVFLGCSMGGYMAVDLAMEAYDIYKATIGLGSGLGIGTTDRQPYGRHPRIANEANSVVVQSLTAPGIPEECKWEMSWAYTQAGLGTLHGDVYYFNTEYNRHKTAQLLDTNRCSVYIMNGEYDYSLSIQRGEELVAKNSGIKFYPMEGLGHFSIIEDFSMLKEKYLMPVLNQIVEELAIQ